MPPNSVLFYINGQPWRVVGVSLAAAAVCFVVWLLMLLLVMVPRYGGTRKLSAEEAAKVAMHPNERSDVDRSIAVAGPAVGAEASFSFDIGRLRAAWKERDYVTFFGLPAFMIFGTSWGWLCFFGIALAAETGWLLGLAAVVLLPITLIPVFMMWAAVYTQLN
jgi:hypothetical protein